MLKSQNGVCVGFAVLTLFALILSSPETVLSAPDFQGKVIKIICGNEAGGGYDRLSRVLAKHLPKYIPGKPPVLVENMVGADSMIAAGHLYNIAKADGLSIGNVNRALPFAQLLKAEGVRFDMRKFIWIGSASVEPAILTIRTDLPYKTIDDLRKAKDPVYMAGLGPAATDYQYPVLLKEFLGLNLKMVNYVSSAAGMLAVEKKEVDGKGGSYGSLKLYIDRGVLRPLIRSRVSEPEIESLPVDETLTADKMGKTIMAMRSAVDLMGRPYILPPGTPADVVETLRDAFAKVLKDPEVQEEANKIKMSVRNVPGEECMKMVNYVLSQPDDIVKEFSKYIKF